VVAVVEDDRGDAAAKSASAAAATQVQGTGKGNSSSISAQEPKYKARGDCIQLILSSWHAKCWGGLPVLMSRLAWR
jgi:hypothetical protein